MHKIFSGHGEKKNSIKSALGRHMGKVAHKAVDSLVNSRIANHENPRPEHKIEPSEQKPDFEAWNEVKETTKDAKSIINKLSESTQRYVDSFKDKPKASQLKLTEEEKNSFDEGSLDCIMFTIMDIPVCLNARVYDLQTLLDIKPKVGDLRLDPFTRDEFYLRDIQAARDTSEKIQEKIKLILENRKKEKVQGKEENIITIAPNGPGL